MTLRGLEGVVAYLDDILVWGSNVKELRMRRDAVLQKLGVDGFRLNQEKSVMEADEVEFLGFRLNQEGFSQTEDRLEVIKEMPPPQNIDQLRHTLGVFTHLREFAGSKFSSVSEPLYRLLRKNSNWCWGVEENAAFLHIQEALLQNLALSHPSWKLPFVLRTDASRVGVGAALYNVRKDGKRVPISFFSKCLPKSMRKKGIPYLEAWAVKEAIKKFSHYLRGQSFTVETDHKPLLALNTKEIKNERIQSWFDDLDKYHYKIVHVPGSEMVEVDALSRLIKGDSYALSHLNWGEEQKKDEEVNWLYQFVLSGECPSPCSDGLKRKLKSWGKGMSISSGVLVKEKWDKEDDTAHERIVVPFHMINQVIEDVHNPSHLGITSTHNRMRLAFWWNNMREDVTQYVRACGGCAMGKDGGMVEAQEKGSWPPAQGPRRRIHMDILGPLEIRGKKQYILVIVDSFSKFVLAKGVESVSSLETMGAMNEMWRAKFGTPLEVVTDQATTFTSAQFTHFIRTCWGSQLIHGIPYHSQDNGQVERMMHTLADCLRAKGVEEGFDDWEMHLHNICHDINMTTHPSTGYSPSYLMFGEGYAGPPPSEGILGDVSVNMSNRQKQMKETRTQVKKKLEVTGVSYKKPLASNRSNNISVGERIVLKSLPSKKLSPKFSKSGIILERYGRNRVLIKMDNGKELYRHIKQVKRWVERMKLEIREIQKNGEDVQLPKKGLRRSNRFRELDKISYRESGEYDEHKEN